MLENFRNKLYTLRFRILASMFLVFALSLTLALFCMWSAQRNKMVAMAQEEAMQVGLTIKAGLRASMLQNDRPTIKKTIAAMTEAGNISRISVLNVDGKVKLTSDKILQEQVYDKDHDLACIECHTQSGQKPQHAFRVVDEAGKPVLRNVLKVENQTECHQCHEPTQRLCGILMIDSSLAASYESLNHIALQVIITGFVTFMVIALLVSYLITIFVTKPMQSLIEGFHKVGGGDFDYWIDIKGSEEIVEIANSFNIMSRAIGRYIKEIGCKSEELSTLYTIVQRMTETIDGQRLNHIAIDLLLEVFKAETVALLIPIDAKAETFEVYWGMTGNSRHHRSKYLTTSQEAPHPTVSRAELLDWQAQGFCQPLLQDKGSRALFPIGLQNMRFALISIVKQNGQSFSPAEKKLFPPVVHHLAISFANARLYSMAITDSLTGLYSKRYLLNVAKELLTEAKQGQGLCLLMLDIDYFKEVNDQFGHLTGDRVLREMAELIEANLRTADVPCRYGGEEFSVFLPNTDGQTGLKIAERLRLAVEQHPFSVEEDRTLHKTISIGLACNEKGSASLEELLQRADTALYRAKEGGRNQVVTDKG